MQTEKSRRNVSEIVRHNLCIGCGLCATSCPENVIKMAWPESLTWQPTVEQQHCTSCGKCYRVCPQSPQCIAEYLLEAKHQGVRFGLPDDAQYFIAYDSDEEKRIRSASGGVTSALLQYVLESGSVDAVIASVPLESKVGEPHFQIKMFRTVPELDKGRSSHYHPMNYAEAIDALHEFEGQVALVGVPCVLRGIARMPDEIRSKIKMTVSLVCGKNVTGAFTDCLATQEGVPKNVPYKVDIRDKVGIPNANEFNNLFTLPGEEIRKNRFETGFTVMWRNYFFSQECCFYCADFYGVDADISIKDAWGRLSTDPLGVSLIVVRSKQVVDCLQDLSSHGRLVLQQCDQDEVYNSQTITPIFKHEKIFDRVVWKPLLRRFLKDNYPSHKWERNWRSDSTREYWRLWLLMKMSIFFYFRFGRVPVKFLLLVVAPLQSKLTGMRSFLKGRR